jgi:beta-glucosidase
MQKWLRHLKKCRNHHMDWEVYPESIYYMLNKFSAYDGVKNILITENGAAFTDYFIDGKINDVKRIIIFKPLFGTIA